MPKASAPEFHQSNGSRPNGPLLALRKLLRHRRSPADCFGANPVASALGNPAGRDPGEAVRTYHEDRKLNPETGTFYLAGIRNFLFGSDIETGGFGTVSLAEGFVDGAGQIVVNDGLGEHLTADADGGRDC